MGSIADELELNMRSVYPGAQGKTAGTDLNTTKQEALMPKITAETAAKNKPNPLIFWGILVCFFLGLMFLARQLGGVESFSNIKMTAYNVVIISLCAVVGISAMKAAALPFKGNGFADVILAA